MAKPDYTACLTCGCTIEHIYKPGRKKKFCSEVCRSDYYKPHTVHCGITICNYCGKEFTQKQHAQKYCCYRCRYKATYKKKQSVMTCKECGVLFLRMPGEGYSYCSDACKPVNQRSWLKQTMTIMTCELCSEPFVPRIALPNAKRCPSCRDRRYVDKAECVYCGKEYFVTTNSTGKYCSFECAAAVNLTRAHRQKYNAKLRRHAGKYSSVEWRECVCCQVNTIGPRIPDTWAGQFCEECKTILGSAISSAVGRIEFLRERLWGKRCKVCGTIFEPYNEVSECCSIKCYSRTVEYKERARKTKRTWTKTTSGKKSIRKQNLTRRARKRTNGRVDVICPEFVFNRDNWTCYLCGAETPRELVGHLSADRAPTVDHVVALAAGGTHTIDNVRCACRLCNTQKGVASVSETAAQSVG